MRGSLSQVQSVFLFFPGADGPERGSSQWGHYRVTPRNKQPGLRVAPTFPNGTQPLGRFICQLRKADLKLQLFSFLFFSHKQHPPPHFPSLHTPTHSNQPASQQNESQCINRERNQVKFFATELATEREEVIFLRDPSQLPTISVFIVMGWLGLGL